MENNFWCRGCDEEPGMDDGVDVDGYGFRICKTCWAKLSTFEKIHLRLLTEQSFDGSPGLNSTLVIENLDNVARKLFRATHGHDSDRACRECDPFQAERDEEDRQKRLAAKSAKDKKNAVK